MEVVTDSDKVKKAQDGVLEFLLINHPLDCPVCDKGGECPLQDQTLAYGPGETRFVEEKRHFEKPIPISELVLLDRERCIQCSRCTRFADEVAGEAQIDFIGRGEQLQIGTFPELPFTSYFSGNTVQICPVGALTATPYRFAARPWDLDQVESTCTTCSVGCRVAVQSSSNRLTRLLGIDIDPVNHGWLCDKGRFAADAVNSEDRLTEPMVRKDGTLVAVSWHEALEAVAAGLKKAAADRPESIGVVGGARLTNEGAYAWARVAKGVLGTDSVDAQLGDGLPAELVLGLPRATIDQAASAATVVLLTGDVREELPVLFLRLRAAAVDGDLSIVELSPQATSLTAHAEVSLRYGPGDAAALVDSLVSDGTPPAAATDTAALDRARQLLSSGSRWSWWSAGPRWPKTASWWPTPPRSCPPPCPVPVSCRPYAAATCSAPSTWDWLPASCPVGSGWRTVVRGSRTPGARCPSVVVVARPTSWPRRPATRPTGRPSPHWCCSAPIRWPTSPTAAWLSGPSTPPDFVVAVATAPGAVLDHADVVLPAAEAHERPGTTTNIEGRIFRLGQKLVPPGQAWPDWMIAGELAVHLGHDLGFDSVGTVWDEIERVAVSHKGITRAVLDSHGAADGVVAPLSLGKVSLARRNAPLDPMAVPGVESVERQGASLQAGLASSPNAAANGHAVAAAGTDGPARPAVLAGPAAFDVPHVSPADGYSVRLIASRVLYDHGTAVTTVGSLSRPGGAERPAGQPP